MTDIFDIFECAQCGDCCFGNEGIRFTPDEAKDAAFYLQISLEELRKLYLAQGDAPWNVRTDFEGYCLFRQADGRCLIHAAKPEACRRWPFMPGPLKDENLFQDLKASCPGLKAEAEWEDFKEAWLREEKES